MFEQLRNIETAFRHVRLFTAVIIVTCCITSIYCVHVAVREVTRAQERIYIVQNGSAFAAQLSSRKENTPAEARHHVRIFHELFFNLSPDEKAINATIREALYLADYSAKREYDNLTEKGYYNAIISGDVSQSVRCDSVFLNTQSYPYYFRFHGKQLIIRTSALITRSLVTEGYLREVDRSDNNAHGFLIEKWVTLDNKDLKVEKR